MNTKPILIITGEPFSIFSEILSKILKKNKFKKPLLLITSSKLLKRQFKYFNHRLLSNEISENFSLNELKKDKINIINVDFNFTNTFQKITNISNSYNRKCFELALKLAKTKKISGIINGPISKKHFLKRKYLGITEYMAKNTLTTNFAMLIYNKNLSVSPITTHVPLKNVSKIINKKMIMNNVHLIKIFYKKYLKKDPSIAITGLNPHCESNYLNSEEDKIIKPAIKQLRKIYNKVSGPYPADSIFMKNNIKKFDVIVGMYHDQVLTPLKSIYNFDAINITLGLPFIRISPDHGPNNKMIKKNLSNPKSLLLAIKFLDNL